MEIIGRLSLIRSPSRSHTPGDLLINLQVAGSIPAGGSISLILVDLQK
jgi:hypothetical protein